MHDRLTRRGGGVLIAVDSELTSDAGSKLNKISKKSAKRINCFRKVIILFNLSLETCNIQHRWKEYYRGISMLLAIPKLFD